MAGRSWFDTERELDLDGFTGETSAEHEVGLLHGKLRAQYSFEPAKWYLMPGIDLDVTHVSFGGLTEQGGNGAALDINEATTAMYSTTPSLEAGGEWRSGGGLILRPFVKAGATIYEDPEFTLSAEFRDGPANVTGFETTEKMDSLLWGISTGPDTLYDQGSSLRIFFDGRFGESLHAHGGGPRAVLRFGGIKQYSDLFRKLHPCAHGRVFARWRSKPPPILALLIRHGRHEGTTRLTSDTSAPPGFTSTADSSQALPGSRLRCMASNTESEPYLHVLPVWSHLCGGDRRPGPGCNPRSDHRPRNGTLGERPEHGRRHAEPGLAT